MTDTPAAAIFVVGPAGSGKSTVARLIASAAGAVLLDKDRLSPLVAVAMEAKLQDPHERESNSFYQGAVLPREYEALLGMAEDNLSIGHDVVLDAPFGAFFDDLDFVSSLRARDGWHDAFCVLVEVSVSESTLRSRLEARHNERDTWKLSNWHEYWQDLGNRKCRWRAVTRIKVVNDDGVDETIAHAIVDAIVSHARASTLGQSIISHESVVTGNAAAH